MLKIKHLQQSFIFHSSLFTFHSFNEARQRYLALLSERFETPFQAKPAKEAEKLYGHLQWQVHSLRKWMLNKQDSFTVWQIR
jgi:hypothetical protein